MVGVKLVVALLARPGAQGLQAASDGDKKARSPGRARSKPLKPLRREGRTASAEPVCSCAPFLQFCTRDRGCSAHPAFPAPSFRRGREAKRKPRAKHAAGSRTHVRALLFTRPRLRGEIALPSSMRSSFAVIPGRCEASNPESRDSPMRNCASEVWCFRTIPE